MATIPSWGPTFKVSLDFYINSFIVNGPPNHHGWAELLRFTSTHTSHCCNIGDRIPAIFTNPGHGGYIHIGTQINQMGNKAKDLKDIEEKKWYKLELTQYKEVDLKQDKSKVTQILYSLIFSVSVLCQLIQHIFTFSMFSKLSWMERLWTK